MFYSQASNSVKFTLAMLSVDIMDCDTVFWVERTGVKSTSMKGLACEKEDACCGGASRGGAVAYK